MEVPDPVGEGEDKAEEQGAVAVVEGRAAGVAPDGDEGPDAVEERVAVAAVREWASFGRVC